MCCASEGDRIDVGAILESVREQLERQGIDFQCDCQVDGPNVKVVCVAPGIRKSVEELGQTARDQVVMVRIDAETIRKLDAWVEAGTVRSRSEAAALFIREGLKVHADELEQLKDALKGVQEAKRHLRDKAREVFGEAT